MDDKKTLAFIIGSLSSGGAERVVSTLSNKLINNYNIVIINFIKAPTFYHLDERIKIVSCVDEIAPSKSVWQAVKTNYVLLRKIIKFFKTYEINVALGFLTTPNILSVLAGKVTGTPIIISERNNPYITDNELSRFWKILRGFSYPLADYLVVQTETIKNFYEKKIDEKKLVIIPNPINPEFDNSIYKTRENIILNVGRLTEQKDQQFLIKAFAKINPMDWRLYIVGEGPLRPTLQQLIVECKMENKIKLIGRSNTVEEYYKKCGIFAFTSKFEGFPNALLEAMHFGMACISTNCPSGPAELISDGKNGILITLDNSIDFEKGLKILMEDEIKRTQIGIEAKKSVQKYSTEHISSNWNSLVRKLLK